MSYVQIGLLALDEESNDFCPVYACVDDSGETAGPVEAFVYDGFSSAFIISNVAVEPSGEFTTEAAMAVINYYGSQGAVLTKDYLIIFHNGEAEWRKISDIDNAATTNHFDMDAEFDEFDAGEIV